MSLRMSVEDALSRNLITRADAETMQAATRAGRGHYPGIAAAKKVPALPTAPKAERTEISTPAAKALAAAERENNEIPQRLLYEALCKELPGIPEWERTGLIPGRRYRADIFLAPDITVEMDGLTFHSSRDAFKADRLRSNLFVLHGYRVFRAFTKQCLDPEMRAELVGMIVQAYRSPVMAGQSVPGEVGS
ncbi:hypothetical protein [Pseudomonas sp. EMN2]|uniref:hypothetical protein n=1 Tax=Pseudomonas sp. EMN2 TaxID=2615212 RepID=UPI00129B915E|nr:hypothetical protein [Pseudomonas sp. EMN2]